VQVLATESSGKKILDDGQTITPTPSGALFAASRRRRHGQSSSQQRGGAVVYRIVLGCIVFALHRTSY